MTSNAAHGGDFFSAIGTDFLSLERAEHVISADVLDAWFDPSPRVVAKLAAHLPFLLRTPPPIRAEGLQRALSEKRGVPVDELLCHAGTSPLIFNCLPQLLNRGDVVLLLEPLYGEYSHVCEQIAGARIAGFSIFNGESFSLALPALLAEVARVRPKVIVMVNPNSPSGSYTPRELVRELLQKAPADTFVVIDETYLEFVEGAESLEGDVARFPNLLILKSLSKIFALSGVRVGYLVAERRFVERAALTVPPWAVALPAQLAAVEALRDEEYYAARYAETRTLRRGLCERLSARPELQIYGSETNFFLVRLLRGDAVRIVERLREQEIFLRECTAIDPALKNFIRIAVQRPEKNARIAEALQALLQA